MTARANLPDHAGEIRRALDGMGARTLLERLGLAKGAQRLQGGALVLCPAHAERTPSCRVQDKDGGIVWFCHGCRASGDALALVAAVRGLSTKGPGFVETLREAAHVAGLASILDEFDEQERSRLDRPASRSQASPRAAATASAKAPKRSDVPTLERPVVQVTKRPPLGDGLDVPTFDALARIILEAHPLDSDGEALSYVRARVVLAEARADGWAALPADPRRRRELVGRIVETCGRDAWQRSGLAKGGDFAHPANRIVIPWRDPSGLVATIQRRALDGRRGKYVFPTGRGAVWPYGIERLADKAGAELPVLLVEGAADVLAVRELASPGWLEVPMRYVPIGLPGVSAWRDEWTELLRGRLLCIGFDRDEAGQSQAVKLAETLHAVGLRFVERWRIRPSESAGVKDWGALLESRLANAGR